MLPHLKQKWQELAARERALVSGLAVFLFLSALYQFVWVPVQESNRQAQMQLQSALQEWQWLVEKAPLVPSSSSVSSVVEVPNDKTELMALLQKRLKQENLYAALQQIQLSGKGVKVVFENVDAARLLRWLENLEKEGILPGKMSLIPVESDLPEQGVGRIGAQIEFEVGR
ncbi:type II secretion system protein GspM [Thiomicrorhabdus sp.]|uniref:type II secretion system protein GspM n=1 Tax=Thiomicrorhabdus sp. TaxID=2039724 RepID=UPI0029C7C8CE|nr:type II secretion system protein GspM [Thiomicrorhabdus sp.]